MIAVWRGAFVPTPRRSVLGGIVRWFLGEPGATQDVNDTADTLSSSGGSQELQDLADKLMAEYAPLAPTLPEAAFGRGRSLPVERLPITFRQMGGSFGDNPDLVLRLDSANVPTSVVISWGHLRHAIIVYKQPPTNPPEGFFVRRVTDRIFVVAGES